MQFTRISCWPKRLISLHATLILYIATISSKVPKFYVVLIQDIKKKSLSQNNIFICHTLRKRNQCGDFFAKSGVSSYADLSIHVSHPEDGRDPLRHDTIGTFLFREWFLF
jgi:hypothetical protein